ncbi:hypothetical protein [Halobacteriovorax sp.]|uniref:hypothetical protein n=1 Tax=Halobacteriovorax sp. TaxID=2020862 RepID=UPI0035666980
MKNFFIGFFVLTAFIFIDSGNANARECQRGKQCTSRNDRGGNRSSANTTTRNRNTTRNNTTVNRNRNTSRNNTTVNRNTSRNNTTVNRNRNTSRNNTTVNRNRNTSRNNTTVNRNRNTSRNNTTVNRNRRTVRNNTRVNTVRRTSAYRDYGHRPNWNRSHSSYVRHNHSSYRYNRSHHSRYNSRRNYFRSVPYRSIYWDRWLRVRVTWNDGYYWNNNYPWYNYNGYSHRYSHVDMCNYELVDGWNNTVERTYYNNTCSFGYDLCASQRDQMNSWSSDYRYFCSERLEGSVDDYGYDYNDDFYSDIYDDSYDGYGGNGDDWDQDFSDDWN